MKCSDTRGTLHQYYLNIYFMKYQCNYLKPLLCSIDCVRADMKILTQQPLPDSITFAALAVFNGLNVCQQNGTPLNKTLLSVSDFFEAMCFGISSLIVL